MNPLATKEKTIVMKPINTRSLTPKDRANQSSFAQPHNPPMTEHLVVPPARVWEKIEMILDQQDMNKKSAVIRSLPAARKSKKAFPIYFAAAGATILAGLFWMYR
jgi:hypothetical protein